MTRQDGGTEQCQDGMVGVVGQFFINTISYLYANTVGGLDAKSKSLLKTYVKPCKVRYTFLGNG